MFDITQKTDERWHPPVVLLFVIETTDDVLLQNAKDLSGHPQTPVELHETLTVIEQFHQQGQFSGSVEHFFRIIEICAAKRPVSV